MWKIRGTTSRLIWTGKSDASVPLHWAKGESDWGASEGVGHTGGRTEEGRREGLQHKGLISILDSAEGKVMRIVKGIKEIELYTGELWGGIKRAKKLFSFIYLMKYVCTLCVRNWIHLDDYVFRTAVTTSETDTQEWVEVSTHRLKSRNVSFFLLHFKSAELWTWSYFAWKRTISLSCSWLYCLLKVGESGCDAVFVKKLRDLRTSAVMSSGWDDRKADEASRGVLLGYLFKFSRQRTPLMGHYWITAQPSIVPWAFCRVLKAGKNTNANTVSELCISCRWWWNHLKALELDLGTVNVGENESLD